MENVDKILYLPLPRSQEELKWSYLKEKLRKKKEKYLEGLKKYGTIHEALLYAEIRSRQTLSNYRNKDIEFAMAEERVMEDKECEIIDMAIKQLYLKIQQGDIRAITYVLDRRSKKFKPKEEVDNNLSLPAGAKEISVTFKDYSNGDITEQDLQTIIHREA